MLAFIIKSLLVCDLLGFFFHNDAPIDTEDDSLYDDYDDYDEDDESDDFDDDFDDDIYDDIDEDFEEDFDDDIDTDLDLTICDFLELETF